MRSLNWNEIEARADGEFKPMPPGGYVVRVLEMSDVPAKEYVNLVWDVAEGEHAGRYSDAWGKDHPYAHNLALSYKDTALGMLKGRLEAIARSNPGFDPFAAWDANRLDMFIGRLFGVNLQEEEYERNDGKTGTRLNVCQVIDAQTVRDGKVEVRAKKALKGGQGGPRPSAGAQASDVYAGDIPFD